MKIKKSSLRKLLSEVPHMQYNNKNELDIEFIDFKIELYPISQSEKTYFYNAIIDSQTKGDIVYAKYQNKWIIFSSQDIYIEDDKPTNAIKLPDY